MQLEDQISSAAESTTCDLRGRRAVQRVNHSWQRDYLAKDDVSISKMGFEWSRSFILL